VRWHSDLMDALTTTSLLWLVKSGGPVTAFETLKFFLYKLLGLALNIYITKEFVNASNWFRATNSEEWIILTSNNKLPLSLALLITWYVLNSLELTTGKTK
jgi:hypothetical protein